VALGWLALAAALLRFGERLLVVVGLIAAGTTLLDLREVILQGSGGHPSVAILAAVDALCHAAVVGLVVLALFPWKQQAGDPILPSRQ
jgi:hypothetical protein